MKKSIIAILIITMLLAACGGGKETDKKAATDNSADTSTETKTKDTDATADDKKDKTDEGAADGKLEGEELIKSVKVQAPEHLYIEYSLTTMGNTTSGIYYIDAPKMRSEMEMVGQKHVIIDDGKDTYVYVDGTKQGMVSKSDAEGRMTDFLDVSLEDIVSENNQLRVAKVVDLDGKEAVYVETGNKNGEQEVIGKFWFSTKYGIILKMDMAVDDKITAEFLVTKIDADKEMGDSLFTPPAEVEFIEGVDVD